MDIAQTHFGPVMDAWCPLHAQNVHNKTQGFYGQHEHVCLGTPPTTSLMVKRAVRGGEMVLPAKQLCAHIMLWG
jgi:hypothetical protein